MKLLVKLVGYCTFILVIGLLHSCSFSATENAPDVSEININKVTISRFEQDLFLLDTLKLADSFEALKTKYPEFLPLYIFEIQGFAKPTDSEDSIASKLKKYIYNSDIRNVFNDVNKKYSDISFLQNNFTQALTYLKYYLPQIKQPQVFTYVAPFQHQALTIGTNKLGIGLDMHLGSDYPFYDSAGHPKYISKTFTKQHLITNSLMAYAKALLPDNKDRLRLIDKMIYQGKLLYLVEQLLPQTDKHLIIGYDEEQLDWCNANQKQIWSYWIEKKLFYETQSGKFGRYVLPSPTTAGMPPESPGNIGSYTGWQIVKSYMQNNPKTTMEELLKIDNGQQILKLSGYKP